MGRDHGFGENWQTGSGAQGKFFQTHEYTSDNELENRIRKLEKLVDSVGGSQDQMSFSRNAQALDIVKDLRAKIKTSHDLLRVAKLLSDPARESMFLMVRDSLNDLEESITSHLGVKVS
jgi:hypothetical protein